MHDYLLWVIIIYFPIALLMGWILHNSGLEIKNILIIILVSFLVVIMFPISITRIGSALSLGLYAAILFIIAHYLMQNQQLTVEQATDEVGDNSQSNPELDSIYKLNLDIRLQKNEAEFTQTITPVTEDESQNSFISAQPCFFTKDEKEESDGRAALNLEEVAPQIKENATATDNIVECEPVAENNANIATRAEQYEQIIANKNRQIFEEGNQTGIESSNSQDQLIIGQSEQRINFVESRSSLNNDAISAREGDFLSEKVIEIEENPDVEMNNQQAVLTEQVAACLDRGFAFKEKGDLQAALLEFSKAWQETGDYELGFLLTLEIFDLYRITGNYAEAERTVTAFAGKAGNIPAIMKEIGLRIKWIKLLRNELAYLGITEMPYAQLPRWVKLKVAEASGIEEY